MFRYFPTNYVWNLSVDLAIEMGARIGEIEEMCAPLQDAAKQPDAAGTKAFRETWSKMAEKLCELAVEDEARSSAVSPSATPSTSYPRLDSRSVRPARESCSSSTTRMRCFIGFPHGYAPT